MQDDLVLFGVFMAALVQNCSMAMGLVWHLVLDLVVVRILVRGGALSLHAPTAASIFQRHPSSTTDLQELSQLQLKYCQTDLLKATMRTLHHVSLSQKLKLIFKISKFNMKKLLFQFYRASLEEHPFIVLVPS